MPPRSARIGLPSSEPRNLSVVRRSARSRSGEVLVVAVAEDQRQDAGLGVVEVQDLAQEQRPEGADAGAHVGARHARQRQDLDGVALRLEGPASSTRRGRRRLGLAGSPGAPTPDRSPLTSTAKTGTPAADSWPARSWSVLVLPVPVAPAMRPWRLTRDSGSATRTSGQHLVAQDRRAEHDDRLVERVARRHRRRGTRRPPAILPATTAVRPSSRPASRPPMIAPAATRTRAPCARRACVPGCARERTHEDRRDRGHRPRLRREARRRAGVKTTDDLLEQGGSAAGREKLAEPPGVHRADPQVGQPRGPDAPRRRRLGVRGPAGGRGRGLLRGAGPPQPGEPGPDVPGARRRAPELDPARAGRGDGGRLGRAGEAFDKVVTH